jgi:hypothetical protein
MPDVLVSSPGSRRRGYARHRPEETLLYRLAAEHLEMFLAETREKHDRALPTYVERELRAYLRCGILAHGSDAPSAECVTARSSWLFRVKNVGSVPVVTRDECATRRRT